MEKKKAVIKIERDWEESESNFLGLGALIVVGLVLAGLGFMYYWTTSGGLSSPGSQANMDKLKQELQFYRDENSRLTMQLAKIERSEAVDSEAAKQLQKTIIERENEIKKLKEELSFYKSIVDPKSSLKGLGIKDFSLEDTLVANQFKFKLVATQSSGKKAVKGQLVLRLQGRKEGKPVTLSWKEFGKGKRSPRFKYQYFQKLEGMIELPDGFEPEHVLVKLVPSGSKVEAIQHSYSWESVFKGGS